MKEYIEREAALKPFINDNQHLYYPFEVQNRLRNIPAADVRPVVMGEWIEHIGETGVEAFGFKETTVDGFNCSICGNGIDVSEGWYFFCPNCGAKMDGGVNDAAD